MSEHPADDWLTVAAQWPGFNDNPLRVLRRDFVLEATDILLLGAQQPTLTLLGWVPIDKWSVLVGHDVTLAKPACVLPQDLKPEMTSLNVGRSSGHCLMLQAKSNRFSANPQKSINLALSLALLPRFCHQDCSNTLHFKRFHACMACRGSGVRVSLAPLDSHQVDQSLWYKTVTEVMVFVPSHQSTAP